MFPPGAFLMLKDGAGKFTNVICKKNEVILLKRMSNIEGHSESLRLPNQL